MCAGSAFIGVDFVMCFAILHVYGLFVCLLGFGLFCASLDKVGGLRFENC